MTQEEKAKAYDEAIEYAHYLINERCKEGTDGSFHRTDLDKMFPELKESDDERIIGRIKKAVESYWSDEPLDEILAWLERQCEHANFCSKIQVGDKVTRNEDGVLVNLSQLKRVAKKDEKQGEQKPKRMVSAEAKEAMYDKPAWSEDDQSNFCELRSFIVETYRAEDASKLITWLESLKERVQPQPKQEWSCGDEAHLHSLITHLEQWIESNPDTTGADIQGENIAWLKSLRPQNRWKPSDEQIEALDFAADCIVPAEFCFKRKVLKELLEQLKKLKGE